MGSLETVTGHAHSIYHIAFNKVRKINASSARNQLQKWTHKGSAQYAIPRMDGHRYMMSIASATNLLFPIKNTNAYNVTIFFLIVENVSSLKNSLHFKKT
jgi:hypothetical protein